MEKKYYICDRCKKELKDYSGKNSVGDIYNACFYDLCEECKLDYEEYKSKVEDLNKTCEELSRKYKFGRYLFREELKDSDD